MRVPDEIRKSVLLIGIRGKSSEWEWRGTGYLIAIPDASLIFREEEENKGRMYHSTQSYPFMFLATAQHVAEHLKGKPFALRTNRLNADFHDLSPRDFHNHS